MPNNITWNHSLVNNGGFECDELVREKDREGEREENYREREIIDSLTITQLHIGYIYIYN